MQQLKKLCGELISFIGRNQKLITLDASVNADLFITGKHEQNTFQRPQTP